MATHLITGVAGQDGVHLARSLLAGGHRVIGTTVPGSEPGTRVHLDGVRLVGHDVRDAAGFAELLETARPAMVHNLAALSSVGASWEAEQLTLEVNRDAVVAMLDALGRYADRHGSAPRFVQASSSEIFGPAHPGAVLDEHSPIAPVSPYGRAKAEAHEAVLRARSLGLDAIDVVLFGHTGPLHAPHFALPSACRQAAEVALGLRERIELHDPTVERDWGSAADYMDCWARAALAPQPPDVVVVATGVLHRLGDLATAALAAAHTDLGRTPEPQEAVTDDGPVRPHDVTGVRGDPTRARDLLGWPGSRPLVEVVTAMVRADLRRLRTGVRHDPADLA